MKTHSTRRAQRKSWCSRCASRYLGISVDLRGLGLSDQDVAHDLHFGRTERPVERHSGMPASAAAMMPNRSTSAVSSPTL